MRRGSSTGSSEKKPRVREKKKRKKHERIIEREEGHASGRASLWCPQWRKNGNGGILLRRSRLLFLRSSGPGPLSSRQSASGRGENQSKARSDLRYKAPRANLAEAFHRGAQNHEGKRSVLPAKAKTTLNRGSCCGAGVVVHHISSSATSAQLRIHTYCHPTLCAFLTT